MKAEVICKRIHNIVDFIFSNTFETVLKIIFKLGIRFSFIE